MGYARQAVYTFTGGLVTIALSGALAWLLEDSYDLVVEGLPRRVRRARLVTGGFVSRRHGRFGAGACHELARAVRGSRSGGPYVNGGWGEGSPGFSTISPTQEPSCRLTGVYIPLT